MDITSLLSEENPTGTQVGKTLVLNLLAEYDPSGKTQRLEQSDLDALVERLPGEADRWEYASYVALYRELSAARLWAERCEMELYNGYLLYVMNLKDLAADNRLRYTRLDVPAILSWRGLHRPGQHPTCPPCGRHSGQRGAAVGRPFLLHGAVGPPKARHTARYQTSACPADAAGRKLASRTGLLEEKPRRQPPTSPESPGAVRRTRKGCRRQSDA